MTPAIEIYSASMLKRTAKAQICSLFLANSPELKANYFRFAFDGAQKSAKSLGLQAHKRTSAARMRQSLANLWEFPHLHLFAYALLRQQHTDETEKKFN